MFAELSKFSIIVSYYEKMGCSYVNQPNLNLKDFQKIQETPKQILLIIFKRLIEGHDDLRQTLVLKIESQLSFQLYQLVGGFACN